MSWRVRTSALESSDSIARSEKGVESLLGENPR
jgi:hypothetical protein